MTPTQLRIQELGADKTLQFGCLLFDSHYRICRYIGKNYNFMNGEENGIRRIDDGDNIVTGNNGRINIIGKPFDYARLQYLIDGRFDSTIDQILLEFYGNRELYQETVLERPEELNKLILEFLESIYPDKKLSE